MVLVGPMDNARKHEKKRFCWKTLPSKTHFPDGGLIFKRLEMTACQAGVILARSMEQTYSNCPIYAVKLMSHALISFMSSP